MKVKNIKWNFQYNDRQKENKLSTEVIVPDYCREKDVKRYLECIKGVDVDSFEIDCDLDVKPNGSEKMTKSDEKVNVDEINSHLYVVLDEK